MDNIYIPDDIYHFLATFLTPVDCMSFCLSGVSPGFTDFYSRKWNWKLSRCYCLEPNICQDFFSKCLMPSNVQVLDLSHCFWLPEATLLDGFFSSELINLRELNVLDTQLSFFSLILKVLPQCQSLTKLSASIPERKWKAFNKKLQDHPDTYKEIFQKIKDLKLYILDGSSPFIWIFLFNVLGWCRDCVQLHLELFQSKKYLRGSPSENNELKCDSVLKLLSKMNLHAGLKWMISLKGFCVLANQPDRCFDEFCSWVLHEINPPNLEKLWIPSVKLCPSHSKFKPGPSLKCLSVGRLDDHQCDFASFDFTQISRLGGISVTSDLKVPQIRFLRGEFRSFPVLDQFCSSHPQLEHLHFDGYNDCTASSHNNRITFQCHWALAHLRTLIFDNDPHPDALRKFMHSCSTLEELHVGRLASSIFSEPEPNHEAYRSISRQAHLRKLTLTGLGFTSGAFLQEVLGNCQKLESLHIAGHFENTETFFNDLCKYLPLAKKLRDLRIQKDVISESLLKDLISSIGSCSTLERLMIYHEEFDTVDGPLQSFLPDCLRDLVANRLPRLVAFCFIYPLNSETVVDISHELNMVSSPRPSFWYHVDNNDLPVNTQFPRVHLDEFINPFAYIDSFPVLL